jgi:tRNA A58 N-methylase Trm61
MTWSHAIGPDGSITGLEFDHEFARSARTALKEHGYENVEIIVGDAAET